jgi:hypothetical protein
MHMPIARAAVATAISWIAAAVLTLALVRHYAWLGGPYFVFPETVQDHVWTFTFPSRDVILLARRAEKILPRNTTVTALEPSLAPHYDATHFLTAAGLMPHHRVLPPKLDVARAELPQFVLAVRSELTHEAYRLHSSWPEGKIYEVIR